MESRLLSKKQSPVQFLDLDRSRRKILARHQIMTCLREPRVWVYDSIRYKPTSDFAIAMSMCFLANQQA